MEYKYNLAKTYSVIMGFVIKEIRNFIESEVGLINELKEEEKDLLYDFATDVLTEFISDDTPQEEYPSKDELLDWAYEIYTQDPDEDILPAEEEVETTSEATLPEGVETMTLPFEGVCSGCGETMPEGSEGVFVDGSGLHHVRCVPQ